MARMNDPRRKQRWEPNSHWNLGDDDEGTAMSEHNYNYQQDMNDAMFTLGQRKPYE